MSNNQATPEGKTREGSNSAGDTPLESSTMVSPSPGNDGNFAAVATSGQETLLPSQNCDCPLSVNNHLQLVAWKVSADSSKQNEFRTKQSSLSGEKNKFQL